MEIKHLKKMQSYWRGTDNAKVIQVIVTESAIGSGTDEDPIRLITQYWDFDGKLLAKCDAMNGRPEDA